MGFGRAENAELVGCFEVVRQRLRVELQLVAELAALDASKERSERGTG